MLMSSPSRRMLRLCHILCNSGKWEVLWTFLCTENVRWYLYEDTGSSCQGQKATQMSAVCHDVGNKDTTGVYSLNVVMLVMDRKCTTAEPSSTLISKVPGYSWWVFCARIMSRSYLIFPAVVSLCRMGGFRAQRRSSCDVPLSVLRGYIQSGEECHINFNMEICPVWSWVFGI